MATLKPICLYAIMQKKNEVEIECLTLVFNVNLHCESKHSFYCLTCVKISLSTVKTQGFRN